ncbi:MAG: protein kinase, partial [Acidobacteria bacterium]|nr:protein kinase [Acidobacteriota bacterium]
MGEGGMGEVYRARDEKLNRDVAIKVLPAELSTNGDRLHRFEQEAQAAGALNHPNILAVYDVGMHDGSPYVVSELLEGETLRELLDQQSLATRKAVDYAIQLAHGLAAAHDKGIVHRDLKPDNIFITTGDHVKILDFGLAKLVQPMTETDVPQTDIATRRVHTDPGTVMGTVGYMSPEQVRGSAVDHRSDIFSFGSILYEMLSGQRAFRRDTSAETMTAILKEEPPEFSQTNSTINPSLERIVRRCLEKQPARRFQTASDLGFALEALSVVSGTGKSEITMASAPAKRRLWPMLVSLGLVLIALGAVAGILLYSNLWKASPPSYQRLTFSRGTVWNARFAPDGKSVIYSARWNGQPLDIYSVRAGMTESRSLKLENIDVLAVSSSGEMAVLRNRQYLGWFISRGTLARMPIEGG